MRARRLLRPGWVVLAVGSWVSLVRCAPEELIYEGAHDAAVDGKGGGGGIDAAAWVEICGNGLDDDKDGKTDCEDPVCDQYACLPAAPSGWTGPAAVFSGAPGSVQLCPAGLTQIYEGFRDLRFASASCSGCSCGSPQNPQCSVSVGLSTAGSCTTFNKTVTLTSTSCVATGLTLVTNADVTSNTASATCAAGPKGIPSTEPSTWAAAVRICAPATQGEGIGREPGKVCAAASGTSDPCIKQAGDNECPAAFPRRRVYYASTTDTRDCGNCGCSYSGGTCTATVNGYATANCTTTTFSTTSMTCQSTSEAQSLRLSNLGVSGSCTSSPAPPTGCVAPESPTTVCCAVGTGPSCPVGKGPAMIEVPSASGSYCVDSTEVTNAHYQAFLDSMPSTATQPAECAWNTSFTPTDTWPDTDADEPVNFVDWCDAQAFCAWAGKRLCGALGGGSITTWSDGQWYNACSAGGTLAYPYGNTAVSGVCQIGNASVKSDPCCVGGYSGVYNMVGNMREWVDSCTPAPGGGGGAKDKCRVAGDSNCNSTAQENRDRTDVTLGIRCCAP